MEESLNEQLNLLTNPPSEAGSESDAPTPQDISEEALNAWLSDHTAVWRNRSNARGRPVPFSVWLRNKAFGITASTQRKMIPARYDRNLEALRLLCERAAAAGQKVLLYIPPIRTDVAPPYDPGEYAQFKEDIASISTAFDHVEFANLEDIVPGPLWGYKASTDGDGEPELDFHAFPICRSRNPGERIDPTLGAMIFNSVTFLVFFTFVASFYWALGRKPRYWFLFLASLVFYGFWKWEYLSVILLSAVTDFVVARKLDDLPDEKGKERKRWLAVSLVINLGLLMYFKYLLFFTENLNGLFEMLGTATRLPYWDILLPFGISFYTFETISYTIDVYRRHLKAEREFIHYGLFVAFFPNWWPVPFSARQN